ncbi:MAG: hypothetical protein QOG48_1915, partial [Verrucomicrobiota bacterium]
MSEKNSNRDNKRNTEPSFNWRGVIGIALAIGLLGLAFFIRGNGYANVEEVPYSRFLQLLENKQIIQDDK